MPGPEKDRRDCDYTIRLLRTDGGWARRAAG